MQNSEQVEESLFTINNPDELNRVTIFDGNNRIYFQDVKSDSILLPDGFYIVRTERNGISEEKVIFHSIAKPATIQVSSPAIYTSLPLQNAVTFHEYYTNPAIHYSKHTTVSSAPFHWFNAKAPVNFLLFVRSISKTSWEKNSNAALLENFYLRIDETIYPLNNSDFVVQNRYDGWGTFSFFSDRSLIYIGYKAEVAREFPVYLYENWQTHVYLLMDPEPRFETLRVTMSEIGSSFKAGDNHSYALDTAFERISSRRYSLPPRLLDELLYGKFENPILGILGLAIYLHRKEAPEKARIELVLRNLKELLGHEKNPVPDIWALEILAAKRTGAIVPSMRFNSPPMLRGLLELVMQEASINPDLLTEDSPIDEVADLLYADSPWSSWKPIIPQVEEGVEHMEVMTRMKNFLQPVNLKEQDGFSNIPPWLLPSLWNLYQDSNEHPIEKFADLSSKLGLTPRRLRINLEQLFDSLSVANSSAAQARIYGVPVQLAPLAEWIQEKLEFNLPFPLQAFEESIPYTPFHITYFASWLVRRVPSDNVEKFTATMAESQIELQPHQVDAAFFAFKSPLSKGALLADEVGLGKTIEAGIVIAQKWAEQKRRILIITPANLRKQWSLELLDKFRLPAVILEKKAFNEYLFKYRKNPFERKEIVIASYEFVSQQALAITQTDWDLVVIDEAHRLRSVYRKDRVRANTIKEALRDRKKILLTATPLQNNLLELFGLVSLIDEELFGDLKSFKKLYGKESDTDMADLRSRLKNVCTRTLRKEVKGFINFTNRWAIRMPFDQTGHEHELYLNVSEYLQRPVLYALPNAQRKLMTLVLRRLLASSTYAISHTLNSFANRVEKRLQRSMSAVSVQTEGVPVPMPVDEDELIPHDVAEDFDDLADVTEDLATEFRLLPATEDDDNTVLVEVDPDDYRDPLGLFDPSEFESVQQEIDELRNYSKLARSITDNAKGVKLVRAVEVGLEAVQKKGGNRKALIFTESRRTQDYLKRILEEDPRYKNKIIIFNGTNSDAESQTIYREWELLNRGSDRISGSKTADLRSALVDYFASDAAEIMIATEAAAEGINLQFCSLVINYDMPWNPQRIEQRIGRCHRYGQKNDVVVVNFYNNQNEADRRVYEILHQKFQLFGQVFDTSDAIIDNVEPVDSAVIADEMMGLVMSGLEFEKRILDIFDRCRNLDEIKRDFDELEKSLDELRKKRIQETRLKIMEHFDASVAESLGIKLKESIDQYKHHLWMIARIMLAPFAEFEEDSQRFWLHRNPLLNDNIPLGLYTLGHTNGEGHAFTPGDLLAQRLMTGAAALRTKSGKLTFRYNKKTAGNRHAVEEWIGKSGWMKLIRITIDALEPEDHLAFCAVTDEGEELPDETCKLFFTQHGQADTIDSSEINTQRAELDRISGMRVRHVKEDNQERNTRYFNEEKAKIERRQEDLVKSLNVEIDQIKKQIKTKTRDSDSSNELGTKLDIEEEIHQLERKKRELRNKRDDREDEIDRDTRKLIDTVRARLAQHTRIDELFMIRWVMETD